MQSLYEYIQHQIDEGLIKNTISLVSIKNIDSDELLNGILSMYEYICDEDDINLFYQDFPVQQKIFWKNLYQLYQKGVWSIFDVNENSEFITDLGLQINTLMKITMEFRRDLRKMLKDSKNSKLDLKASQIDKVIALKDPKSEKIYIITLNRTTGFLSRLFRKRDSLFLEKALEKLGVDIKSNSSSVVGVFGKYTD